MLLKFVFSFRPLLKMIFIGVSDFRLFVIAYSACVGRGITRLPFPARGSYVAAFLGCFTKVWATLYHQILCKTTKDLCRRIFPIYGASVSMVQDVCNFKNRMTLWKECLLFWSQTIDGGRFTSVSNKKFLTKQNISVIAQPLYSPVLSPSVHVLFPRLKNH